MENKLKGLQEDAKEEIISVDSLEDLEKIRVKYLGKKGELTEVLRGMGNLSPEERPIIGKIANEVRGTIESLLEEAKNSMRSKKLEEQLANETIDITMPGKSIRIGKKHPLTQSLDDLKNIFIGMGFKVVEGPEVETVY